MNLITALSAVAPRYDALLLDLWGVIHDGTHLYPGVHDTLTQLRRQGKKIIMLSNAPRRAARVASVLGTLGIEPGLYDHVVSSGEAGYAWLSNHATLGKRYFYIGPPKDADALDGLDYRVAASLEEADFLLNVGFGSDDHSSEDYTSVLQQARAQGLPMVCLNPDLEVVKITGERYPCAGVLAHLYEEMGGEVVWFGKPYPMVYERCHELLGGIPKARMLAVGDSLETDMPGAAGFGIDGLLIIGGILKPYSTPEIAAMCEKLGLTPTYAMARFNW